MAKRRYGEVRHSYTRARAAEHRNLNAGWRRVNMDARIGREEGRYVAIVCTGRQAMYGRGRAPDRCGSASGTTPSKAWGAALRSLARKARLPKGMR